MARNMSKPGLEACDQERVFRSPVALAFVRIVVARRGITQAQARQIYLDYINRTQPGRDAPAECGCVN
ncbi:hypothetical protein [Bradyrhizobium sp. STM 3557]|uniref:hypothetical protein n=1 Tax=Bradyrhizobium sp. STM 3557 TaxID=578920 RepID=UPI0038905079